MRGGILIFNFLKNEKSWFPWVVYYFLFSIGCYAFLYALGFDTTNYNVIHATTIFINLLFLYLLLEYFYWNDLKNSFKVKVNVKIISKVFTFAILGVVVYLSSALLYDRFVLYFDIKTLVFMILHMTLYHLIVGFFIVLYLGYLRYYTGGLIAPIITHIAINGFIILSMYLIRYLKVSPDIFSGTVYIVSMVLLFIFYFLFFRNYFKSK